MMGMTTRKKADLDKTPEVVQLNLWLEQKMAINLVRKWPST
jgi:hypothetical protein